MGKPSHRVLEPRFPWEFIQLGNCGSPMRPKPAGSCSATWSGCENTPSLRSCSTLRLPPLFDHGQNILGIEHLVFFALEAGFRAAVLGATSRQSVPFFERNLLPLSVVFPVPSATTLHSIGFSLAMSGITIQGRRI